MIAFDNRTAFIVIALLYVVLPIFAWITLVAQRQRAVALWCGGGLLLGIGFLLVGLRGRIPGLYSFDVANLLLLVGMLLRVQSLRLDLQIGWRARWMALAVFAYVAIYKTIQLGFQDASLRLRLIYLLYLALAGLVLHLSLLARKISQRESSPSANWIARVYFLVAAAMLLRQLSVISGNGDHALAPALVTQIFSIAILLAAVVGHIGYVGLALDRSLHHEIEVATDQARDEVSRRLGGKIAHLDRQRVLGSMSASLGHELNQPLSAILTNAQVARRGMQAENFDRKQAAEVLEKIVSSVHRAGQIIERIRGFIVPSVRTTDVVDIKLVVQEVLALAAEDAESRNVKIFFIPGAQPARVVGDAIQFSQVILNVVRNAMEALSEVARREIHLTILGLDGHLLLRVRDTGPGLEATALAQAGQPFFTTKTAGLGMGLFISRSIMEQFGGKLNVQNADEGGTLVEIEWPARSGSADRGPS
jgi:C4-dicarboxylate-specific signal transduction histidine kinase